MFKAAGLLPNKTATHHPLAGWRALVTAAQGRHKNCHPPWYKFWRRPFSGFTLDEKILAADWDTCAVGEAIHRYQLNLGRALTFLQGVGVNFCRAVLFNDFDECHRILDKIEEWLDAELPE